MKSFVIYIFSVAAFFILNGCQTIETRGQFIQNDLVSELKAQKTTKAEVVRSLGTPTLVSLYGDNSWYYVERTTSQRAWLVPKIIGQRIVKIDFDNDVVREVKIVNGVRGEDVLIVDEYTKTYGTELSGIQKFIKNFGRFNNPAKESRKNMKKKKRIP